MGNADGAGMLQKLVAAAAAGGGAGGGGGGSACAQRQVGGSAGRARRGGGGGEGGMAGGDIDHSGAETPDASGVGSKRKAVYESLLSPAAKAARTGWAAGAAGERPAYDERMVEAEADMLCQWGWRASDGTYEKFETEQCVEFETCCRKGVDLAAVWGRQFPVGHSENLKCALDFTDMTAMVAGSEWLMGQRRDDGGEVGSPGGLEPTHIHMRARTHTLTSLMIDEHQVDDVSMVRVEQEWVDYALVASALLDRKRADGKRARLSRETHRIVQLRRIQNWRQRTGGSWACLRPSARAWRGSGKAIRWS
jgi:hypothetical protein